MSPYPFCTAGKKNQAIRVKSLNLTTDDRDDILKGRKLNDQVINIMLHKRWWNASFLTRKAFKIQLCWEVPKHGMGWCGSGTHSNSIWSKSEALGLCEQQVYRCMALLKYMIVYWQRYLKYQRVSWGRWPQYWRHKGILSNSCQSKIESNCGPVN